jgi:hypothetical protein
LRLTESYADVLTLQEHRMPKTKEPTDSEQFSVSLPREAIRVMMQLKGKGLYGTTRGAIARTLILARLEDLAGRNVVKLKEAP